VNISLGNFSTGTVTVKAENGCGSSNLRSLSIAGYPTRPEPISGSVTPCGSSVETYSVPTVGGTSSYNWTVSTGGFIQSGQGTKDIQVAWNTFPQPNQSLRVVASNACGNSTSRALNTITVSNCNRLADGQMAVEVYPNPATEFVIVELGNKSATSAHVGLWDLSGRLLREATNGLEQGGQIVLSVQDIPSGIYIIVVEVGSEREMIRVAIH
jgi:hypothetical protein